MKKVGGILGVSFLALLACLVTGPNTETSAQKQKDVGVGQFRDSWHVLAPITRHNLSIYPVVSNLRPDTSGFLSLDEGIAQGSVRIVERGQVEGALLRRRRTDRWPRREEPYQGGGGASVNELVLINDSPRPLLLLAGELVSGGKQNRVIGADLVVPPKSDPLPLTVFCVEHGRWSAGQASFGSAGAIAHPQIRRSAQVHKSQQGVWDSVSRAANEVGAASPTQDYLGVLSSPSAKRKLDEAAQSIQTNYERELRDQLKGRGVVGVVVAIDGELVWSDVFSSSELFQKYWPKLLRSYVMEAESHGNRLGKFAVPSIKEAGAYLSEDRGRVTVKLEPEAYRRTEIAASDYQIVALEALGKLEESGLLLHYNKMERE